MRGNFPPDVAELNRGDVSLRLVCFHQQQFRQRFDLSDACNVKKGNFSLWSLQLLAELRGELISLRLLRSVSLAEWFWTPCRTGEEGAFYETLPPCYATRPLLIRLSFTLQVVHLPKKWHNLCYSVCGNISSLFLECNLTTYVITADTVAHWKANRPVDLQNGSFNTTVVKETHQNCASFVSHSHPQLVNYCCLLQWLKIWHCRYLIWDKQGSEVKSAINMPRPVRLKKGVQCAPWSPVSKSCTLLA